ncbi:hypothetical protein J2W32_006454 [Variovorax boronicumulans]|uniref:Uncharacterized protein n=1 Tax=Variovorax boronicumulans TaxID=436515 RepID=A0AAW8D9Z7_9BURK|nr:hypothetical protein [Variovorax boronicumulans]MDP9897389.1 hypothetical protein [Variovorax boronicumulans]MDQ0057377.1 hypothetical protein [Variovorax boronicumulans]
MAGRWYPGVDAKRLAARKTRRELEARAIAAAARATPPSCWICKGEMPEGIESAESWWPCCTQKCHAARELELDRREEVREARRMGLPVAEFRAPRVGNRPFDPNSAPAYHSSMSSDTKTPPPGLTEEERLMWLFDHNPEAMTDDETVDLSVLMVDVVRKETRGELEALAKKRPEDLTDSERILLKVLLWLNQG